MNWILVDEQQLKPVTGNQGFVAVPQITGTTQKQLLQANGGKDITITKNGYLYVYVSNESKGSVYFDDIRIEHKRGTLLEETHYYPFGLTMSAISSKALSFGDPGNRMKYNSKEEQRKEFVDGSGLEWLDYGARMYDNQIGRWFTVDPHAEKYYLYSPFAFVINNPLKYRDEDGRDAVVSIKPNKDNQGGTITIMAKVYLRGDINRSNSKAALASDNNLAKQTFKDGSYTDKNGNKWDIKFDVTYEPNSKATFKELKAGENIMDVGGKVNRSVTTNTWDDDGKAHKNHTDLVEKDNGTVAVTHETGHLLGLDDRYTDVNGKSVTDPGYDNDLMGADKQNLDQSHYDAFGQLAVEQLNQGKTTFEITNIIDRRKPKDKEEKK